jgi:hypothetical protein
LSQSERRRDGKRKRQERQREREILRKRRGREKGLTELRKIHRDIVIET